MYTKATERFRTRVILPPQTTAAGAQAYLSPTPGVMGITIRSIARMGNAADLVLSLKYADDASGTNATDFPTNVFIFENGIQQAAGKVFTVDDSTGNFIVDMCIDPATIPNGKFIGVSYANSNAANFVSVELIEDVSFRPYA